MSVPSTFACRFVDTDWPGTCERYDDLVTAQRCLHISKTPIRPGLELYAVMDSNCHHAPGSQQVCDKSEGTWLRIVARLTDEKSSFPSHVIAEYDSHDAQLLRFPGGRPKGNHSILSRKKPILIPPRYAKSGGVDCNADHVQVERKPEDQLKRVPVEIRFRAWRGRNGKKHTAKTLLNVAVPPRPTLPSPILPPEGGDAGSTVASVCRVFVSHSSQDKPFVRKLVDDLKSKTGNLDVFFDESELLPGDSIAEKISDALGETDYLVVVLSEASMKSKWVKAELNAGLARKLSDGGTVVIPVLMENCKLPTLLKDLVYADFRSSYDDGLARLLEVFGQEARPPSGVAVADDDCPSKLRRMSIGDLRRLMRARVERDTIRSVWNEVLGTDMDAEMPNRGITDCLVDLFQRVKNRDKMDELYQAICKERSDITDA